MTRTAKTPKPLPEPPKFRKAKAEIAAVIAQAFASHLDPSAAYADPKNIVTQLHHILDQHLAPPRPIAQNLADVSDETYEKFEHRVMVERPITRLLVRAMQRKVKQSFFWSAKDMAAYLNIDRSTLKKIESGTRAPSDEFEHRFRRLERHVAAWTFENRERDRQTIIVESEFPMPRRYRIKRRLKQCRRCKKYFEPTRGNNILCHTKECETRKKKRHRRSKEKANGNAHRKKPEAATERPTPND